MKIGLVTGVCGSDRDFIRCFQYVLAAKTGVDVGVVPVNDLNTVGWETPIVAIVNLEYMNQ